MLSKLVVLILGAVLFVVPFSCTDDETPVADSAAVIEASVKDAGVDAVTVDTQIVVDTQTKSE